jgi:hypothetical protein
MGHELGRVTMIKMRVQPTIISLIVLLILAACQPQSAEIVELPTLAVLPSLTPSDTPTFTLTPSATLTSTATSTLTPTPTPTATLTATITASVTSSITPTYTLTPTPTASATPTATNTPVATNTPNAPQILSFGASATTVQANSSITLSWNTISDAARIDQLNAQGVVTQTFSIVPSGTLPVLVPGSGQLVVYRLVAQRGGQEVTQSLPITVLCATTWFFGNEFAPPGAGCPTAVGAIGTGAFQPYERGYMLYVNANNLNTIYGIQLQDSRYISYPNGWDGTTSYSCWGTVGGGLFAPQSMFAWVYCTTNPPVAVPGGWGMVIGLATANIDTGSRTIQYEEGTGAFYVDAPIGVFRFVPSTGVWSKIK